VSEEGVAPVPEEAYLVIKAQMSKAIQYLLLAMQNMKTFKDVNIAFDSLGDQLHELARGVNIVQFALMGAQLAAKDIEGEGKFDIPTPKEMEGWLENPKGEGGDVEPPE
jgi:hypothetical protein